MAKSGRLEHGDSIYGHYRSIFNHSVTDIYVYLSSTTATYLASKAIEFGEKRKTRAITPFKIIQGHRGRYQSKARMRLSISDE